MKRHLLVGGLAIVSGSLFSMGAKADPPELKDKLPTLTDAIQYQNEFCTYKDEIPFVENIHWDHPLIQRAGRAFGLILTDEGIKDRVVALGFMSQADADAAFASYDKGGFGSYLLDEGKITAAQLEEAQVDGVGASRSTMTYGDHITIYKANYDGDWGANSDYYELVSSFNGLDYELSRINRERDDLKSDLAAGSVTQSKYDKEMAKLDSKEATARKLDAMGAEGREQELEKIDQKVARGNYENFIRSLLGEFRDYPYMIQVKLGILADHTPVSHDEPQAMPAKGEEWLFDSLTGPGYSRLRWILDNVFDARESRLNPNGNSRFNYGWNTTGHGANRTDHSVAAFTHAEMRYIYTEWLSGEEKQFDADKFEAGLAKFIETQCDSSPNGPDLGYSYDFRGHKNFKANWMECNGFIWNSRDAARVLLGQIKKGLEPDYGYYQRPFATRYNRTKMCMGAYLFYPSRQHKYMRQASESGGGPHLYVDNVDTSEPADGVADYRLFPDVMGQGDIGLGSQALPSSKVYAGEVTKDNVWSFNAVSFSRYRDWGFNHAFKVTPDNADKWAEEAAFDAADVGNFENLEWGPETWDGRIDRATYKLRMGRLCQALDRHTNWGPTMMFSPEAAKLSLYEGHQVRGAYSPVVAMSYEISKSHNFATGDYPSTHPKDSGKTKLMFIVKFKTRYYYDERHVARGWFVNWDRSYINESSCSNDYYHERALDKFGFIPAVDMHTATYLAEAGGERYYSPGFNAPVGGTGFIQALGGGN